MDQDRNPYAPPATENANAGDSFEGLYSFLGAIAGVNQRLHLIRINGVRLDTWATVVLTIVALLALLIAVQDGRPLAWLVLALATIALATLLACRFYHGIVFRSTAGAAITDTKSTGSQEAPSFLASGRFTLWEGDRRRWERILNRLMSGSGAKHWFLEVPATLVVHDEQSFSITAFLDPSLRVLGISLEQKGGRWTIDGKFDSLASPELGSLYLGFRSRPALRLRFQNRPGRSNTVVLTFDDEVTRLSFLEQLHSV
jgi:hypothetical protein